MLFLVFINDLSDSGKSSIFLLMTPPSAVPSVLPQIGKQQPLHSLQIWIKPKAGLTLGAHLSSLTNLTLTMSLQKDGLQTTPHPHPPIHLSEQSS